MVLPSQRKRRAERDAAEAEGKSLWTEEFPVEARVKIKSLLQMVEDEMLIMYDVTKVLEIDGGHSVSTSNFGLHQFTHVGHAFALDIIAAAAHVFGERPEVQNRYGATFERFVNGTLEDYRVAYRLVDHELVPIESDELHNEVVAPAIGLLVGEKFRKANEAYIGALKEVPVDPSDAITDAGVALQATLEALGCQGNALGPLIKDAKKQRLLAGHDTTLTDGIEKFMHWASADRSETGDAHKVSDATRADAWLTIHIVGALIVRLADETPRGTQLPDLR